MSAPVFEGRVAVVTGGASGVGLALARQLLEAGARVAIVDRDEAALDRALEGSMRAMRSVSRPMSRRRPTCGAMSMPH